MGHIQNADTGAIGTAPACRTCGSERVVKDAWAIWNPASGLWELENVFDDTYCLACESETKVDWKRLDGAEPPAAVRELNDRFRCEGRGNGSVVATPRVSPPRRAQQKPP